MVRVLPDLHLSSWEGMQECPDEAYVVNCTKDLPMRTDTGFRLPVGDGCSWQAETEMRGHIDMAADVIDSALRNGLGVHVHCLDGCQRSPTAVTAFLMKHRGMTAQTAISHVQACKRDAFLDGVRFMDVILHFSKSVQNKLDTFDRLNGA